MKTNAPDMGVYFVRHVVEDPQGRGWGDYRIAPGGTVEFVNLEVQSQHRRHGVATWILNKIISELPPDVRVMYCFTRAKNAIAQQWFKAVGFTLHLLPGFYNGIGEDAYCCIKLLNNVSDGHMSSHWDTPGDVGYAPD